MPLASRIASLFRNRLDRGRGRRELDDELRFTFETLVEEKVAGGMSLEAARRETRLELGGTEQLGERVRDAWVGAWLDGLAQNVRFAIRALRKNPGFTFVAVSTIALGIGANSAIFSVVHAVLVRDLPYVRPDRLVMLQAENQPRDWDGVPIPVGVYEELRAATGTLDGLAAYADETFTLVGGAEPLRVGGARVSDNLLPLLGVGPIIGRAFDADDTGRRQPDVALIGEALWQRYYGGDPDIVGRSIVLDDAAYTVVGVMPRAFRFPAPDAEIWTPIAADPERSRWGSWFLDGVGRLGPDTSIDEAQLEVEAITARFADKLPFGEGWSFRLQSLTQLRVGDVRRGLLVLFAAVGLVLLIACANVANLLLAQAGRRRTEFAVRAALGASRYKLVGQLITENLVLALAGGLLGLLVVHWALDGLVALLPADFPRTAEIRLDGAVIAFALAAAVATAVVSGLLPALQASRVDLNDSMRHARTAGTGRRTLRVPAGQWLIGVEFALSVVLLVGAGLLVHSFVRLTTVDPGFRTENTLTLRVVLPENRYAEAHRQLAFFTDLVDRASRVPGVQSVATTTGLPTRGARMLDGSLTVMNRSGRQQLEQNLAIDVVSPGYFRAMDIPLREGRDFVAGDDASAAPVVIVNETLARRMFPGESAVGGKLLGTDDETWLTIVGVSGDVKQFGLDQPAPLQAFLPQPQRPLGSAYLVVHTRRDPTERVGDLKQVVHAIDSDLPIGAIATLDATLGASVASERFNALLMAAFGLLALTLAIVGVYGVVSCAVTQRTREIGVRVALGANAGNLLRMVLLRGMAAAAAGLAVGVVVAVALTRHVESLLFGVAPTDPLAFGLAALLLLVAALVACLVPARRAMRVDPVVALRWE